MDHRFKIGDKVKVKCDIYDLLNGTTFDGVQGQIGIICFIPDNYTGLAGVKFGEISMLFNTMDIEKIGNSIDFIVEE